MPPVVSAGDLRRTLRRGALGMAFQPLWDLRRGQVFGYEALARFGPVSPELWFGASREHGLEIQLNRLACGRALSEFAPLAAATPEAFLFLNVSSPASAIEVAQIAARSPLHDRIVIELTEALVAQAAELVYVVAEIRRLGLRLAVDDMGSGFSDSHRFQLLAPEVMKLDRGLVTRLVAGRVGAERQMREYIQIAETAGCYVLAEGIERENWLDVLAGWGVAMAQGFALGRPAPAENWLGGGGSRPALAHAPSAMLDAVRMPPRFADDLRGYLCDQASAAEDEDQDADFRLAPALRDVLLAALDEATGPQEWLFGPSARLSQRIASIGGSFVAISHAFAELRADLTRRILEEKDGLQRAKIARFVDWLDALQMVIVRQKQRASAQSDAFRDEELGRNAHQTAMMRELLDSLGKGQLEAWVPERVAQIVTADEVALVLTTPDGRIQGMLTFPLASSAVHEATEHWLRARAGQTGQLQRHVAGGSRRLRGPFAAMMAAPITFDGQRIGVLCAWRREPVRFSRRDGDTFALLAGQIAAVVRANARQTEVLRREYELVCLEELAHALRETDHLQAAGNEVVGALQRLLAADRYFVAQCRGAGVRLVSGLPRGMVSGGDGAITAGLRWVVGHREPLFLREGALAAPLDVPDGFGEYQSVVVAPVLAHGEVVGGVGVLGRDPQRFAAHHVETLERVAAMFSLVHGVGAERGRRPDAVSPVGASAL